MMLYELTAYELNKKLQKKEFSSKELTDAVNSRIESVEKNVDAYVTFIEGKPDNNDNVAGIFRNIPVAVKDNICTKGIKTTCSSKILENYVPIYDATVVKKLKEARVAFTGITNLDEFAMGSSTENSAFKITKNPWDTKRVPGGSSGGSAAAVAAGECIAALGSDTGGSIRQPASFCGVVGMKPTYGLVSRYGLVAFASSLDQIGPITKDVTDCAHLLKAIAGHDAFDSTSLNTEIPDYPKALTSNVKGLKIGVIKELVAEGIESGIEHVFSEAAKKLESKGAQIVEVSMPHIEYALPAYYLIAPSEASSNLARFDGVRYGFRAQAEDLLEMYKKTRSVGFGEEVKRRIMLGTYALSTGYFEAYYGQAQKIRTLIIEDFKKAFEKADVLVSPTTPSTAFEIGEKTDDPLQMYLSDIATIPANLAGIPAISVPCGLSEGLPVGFQIMGKHLDEMTVLKTAYALEQTIEFKEKPKLN
ncbi:MAG: Asp-tRNA(Asn)/Glu-tRNA(Gln) amidotransferase subunit GatA [Actinobacteria bacterium]|nr:MAG: Asp-tRNA(Asn)/Glu-tRNA(Gln) amidotransferase subunit GatA [Actinomycetota bacterium]